MYKAFFDCIRGSGVADAITIDKTKSRNNGTGTVSLLGNYWQDDMTI